MTDPPADAPPTDTVSILVPSGMLGAGFPPRRSPAASRWAPT